MKRNILKPGWAFSDHIKTEKLSRRRFHEGVSTAMRDFLPLLFLIVIVGVLVFRLSYLQFVKGAYYENLSDANRTRTKIIHAPRGIIFDRNGTPLVFNIPGFREKKGDKSVVLTREEALTKMAQGGSAIEIDSLRQYPHKEALAHVIGYIGQISKEELEAKDSSYMLTDWVGKDGIEKVYEDRLKGVSGKQLIEVDALGKEIRKLGQTDPIPGGDITLTIDAKLQEAVYNAMLGVKRGAAIVSTPQGEVLALVSMPSFDPNLFTMGSSYKTDGKYTTIGSILSDSQAQPLLDRSVGGVYPPGSTFKLITAAAGLEGKIFDENYRVTDTGVLRVGEFSFANWFFTQYGRREPGELNVIRALSRSNDIFFYTAAGKIGEKKLSSMSQEFGLGRISGIDLPGEVGGLVPSDAWKRKTIGEGWYLGDTFHYGIGQGFLLTTPMQVNVFTEVIANGGTLYKPHLLQSTKSKALSGDFLSDKTVGLIRQGMIESCSTGGVAWPLFEFSIKNQKLSIDGKNILEDPKATMSGGLSDSRRVAVACKTGTAQHGGEETMPHAWITLFAPAYDPQIVVTVLSEESGEGSSVAGPIAKKILEAYFGR